MRSHPGAAAPESSSLNQPLSWVIFRTCIFASPESEMPDSAGTDPLGVTVSPEALCENVVATVEPSTSTLDTVPKVAPPDLSAERVTAPPFQLRSVA